MISIERAKHLVSYEPDTGVFRWKNPTSRRVRVGDEAGSVMSNGYLNIRLDGNQILAHRLAWWFLHGHMPDYIDHANGVRLDNRISNLRPASKGDNAHNLSKPSHGVSSRFKGVHFCSSRKNWKAQICVNKKRKHLGRFQSEVQAAAAYDWNAALHFGQFAKTNGEVVFL